MFPNLLWVFAAFHSWMTLTSTLCYSSNIIITLSCIICDLKCQGVLQKWLHISRNRDRRQVSNGFPYPMHAHFAVVYLHVPWRICLSECSLGNYCKLHRTSLMHCSLKSELWQQGKGSKTTKPSPSEGWKWLFLIKVLKWGLFRN